MKLVCLSDTHNNQISIPNGDLLIFSGDWGCSLELEQSYRELLYFKNWFKLLPHRHKVIIAGNHDTFAEQYPEETREVLEDFIYLENSGVEIEGIKLWGSPFTPMFGPWSFMRMRGRMKDIWKLIPNDTDILITHGPPFERLDLNLQNIRCGCEQLKDRIEEVKPKLHVFGHIHPGHGITYNEHTTFVNCSICNDNPQRVDFEPIILDWPLEEQHAE